MSSASIFLWCASASIASLLCANEASAQTEREALQRLSSHYESVDSASLRAIARIEDGTNLAIEVSIEESGSFATLDFSDRRPPLGLTWDERPAYFVFFDGENMYSARAPGSSYERTVPDSNYVGYPPPIQHALAPWPVISAWADALASSDDTTFLSFDSGEFSARSISLGIAIQWDETMRIRSVFRSAGKGDAGMEVQFAGYDSHAGRESRPARMRLIIRGEVQKNGDVRVHDVSYTITRIEFNRSDIAQQLRFDAKKLQVNRFDRATSNVYSPDGDLLFNEDDFYEAYLAANSTRRFRPWMIVVLVSLFLGSGYIAYRRFGPRLVGGDGGNKA